MRNRVRCLRGQEFSQAFKCCAVMSQTVRQPTPKAAKASLLQQAEWDRRHEMPDSMVVHDEQSWTRPGEVECQNFLPPDQRNGRCREGDQYDHCVGCHVAVDRHQRAGQFFAWCARTIAVAASARCAVASSRP